MQCSSNSTFRLQFAFFALALFAIADSIAGFVSADDTEWKTLFDGKTLTNWEGDTSFWSVEDGSITGQTAKDHQTKHNTFLIWRGGDVGDFELTAEYKLIGGNSGIQYRSFEVPGSRWVVAGYQADMDGDDTYTGSIYGEKFRNVLLASRGQKTVIGNNHRPKVVGSLGDPKELAKHIKHEGWNTYQISARGFHFEQRINGVLMSVCDDEDTLVRRKSGILALQLHAGYVMKVQFRNIKVRALKPDEATSQSKGPAGKRKIVFIAGKQSHGYAAHEHKAGCLLLAKALNENVPDVETEVVTNGWPKNPHILDDAACIVVYADGGKGHPLYDHLDEIDALMKKGIGLVCIHYAVEVPKGKSGERMSEWTGGYFEPSWSVNPHWTATYRKFPAHDITRGVKPFTINDEWYYHMRFIEGTNDMVPILVDLPPASSLDRPDGPYGGNKYVRAAIANKEPQIMAWARQRPDGGRGFGITGGHVHWNWGNDNFRKLVLNAIVWAAHVDVPSDGVPSRPLTVEDLEANQDEPQPPDHNRARVQKLLNQWRAESGS